MTPNHLRIMEFAHNLPINVRNLARKGQEVTLTSNAAQRVILAQNHGLEAVEYFEARFYLTPRPRGSVHLNGNFTARVVQNCVLSGEALTAEVKDHFTLLFIPQTESGRNENEVILTLEPQEEDMINFFDGHEIDLGAVVEEFFCLALDPYPRKEGAKFYPTQIGQGQEDEPPSPFAALEGLLKGRTPFLDERGG